MYVFVSMFSFVIYVLYIIRTNVHSSFLHYLFTALLIQSMGHHVHFHDMFETIPDRSSILCLCTPPRVVIVLLPTFMARTRRRRRHVRKVRIPHQIERIDVQNLVLYGNVTEIEDHERRPPRPTGPQ